MIPKIIHLTWFGGKQLPPNYQNNLNRWVLLAAETDWKVCVWTDESDVLQPFLSMLSDMGAKPVQISNVMRSMVLYMHGGMYVDFDVIPLRLPEFEYQDRFNLFYEVSWDTALEGSTGERIIAPNHAYMAAPAGNRHVLELFWKTVQNTPFNPDNLPERKAVGVGVFKMFPSEWFAGIAKRNVNHFAPVNWAQVRVLNMVENYTYDDWLKLAESLLQHPQVYGVHTFDSSWVAEFNTAKLSERNPENEQNTSDEGTA